ncbi:hypothetical protein GCM10020331_086680 [Ectobacillus funiculus]
MDGLFCLLTESIDKELLDKAKDLKVISNMAVGYNNIDIAAAKEKGVRVTNTPGVLTETTADLTFALLMSTARRLVESTEYLKKREMGNMVSYAISRTRYIWGYPWNYRDGKNRGSIGKTSKKALI